MQRDENLLAAVEAGAERDKQILAALNRDDSFKKNVKNIADTLEKKLQHGAARRDKRKNLKDFEIKPDVEPDPFARGGQAVVKLGEYAGETVCIKCINMVGVPASERMKMYQSFATELSIMVRLRHPRIVQVLGIITTDATYLGLVMEYMPGGSLRQALNKAEEEITEEFKRFWASDVAQGMAYLYSCKIEHRDLKAANVLLTLDGRGKISDFGLGKADDLKTSTTATTMRDGGAAGTPAFMAPELLSENIFTRNPTSTATVWCSGRSMPGVFHGPDSRPSRSCIK